MILSQDFQVTLNLIALSSLIRCLKQKKFQKFIIRIFKNSKNITKFLKPPILKQTIFRHLTILIKQV